MLQELGKKYETDKSTHVYKGVSYLDIYERHFESIRFDVKVFVEIGVLNGRSLKMWREYFPNAKIYGIDINPDVVKYEEENITIFVGDQNNPEFLQKIINEIPDIDILLDDGSHITKHQITTYEYLKNKVKKGGFYCIEDLRNSYEEFLNHHDLREIWPGMRYNEEKEDLKNYRVDFNNWVQNKIKSMDFHDPENNLLSIHHYPMIVIFESFK